MTTVRKILGSLTSAAKKNGIGVPRRSIYSKTSDSFEQPSTDPIATSNETTLPSHEERIKADIIAYSGTKYYDQKAREAAIKLLAEQHKAADDTLAPSSSRRTP